MPASEDGGGQDSAANGILPAPSRPVPELRMAFELDSSIDTKEIKAAAHPQLRQAGESRLRASSSSSLAWPAVTPLPAAQRQTHPLTGSSRNTHVRRIFALDLDYDASSYTESPLTNHKKSYPSASERNGNAGDDQSAVFSRFSAHLQLFSYVLLLAGLRQSSSRLYRNWLRVVVWGCTAMCLANIFFQTASYRNLLFDVSLFLLHVLVSVSYERWLRYCRSREWRVLMSIVTRVSSQQFARHIRQLGWLGLTMVAGATVVIVLGWELPIFGAIVQHSSDHDSAQSFVILVAHGVFMLVIIIPWSAVCIASVCLFKLVVLAHQSDIEEHFHFLKRCVDQNVDALQRDLPNTTTQQSAHAPPHQEFNSARSTYRSNVDSSHSSDQGERGPPVLPHDVLSLCFREVVRHHQALRGRLRFTCRYFNALYASYVAMATLLVFAAAMDFNNYATNGPFPADGFHSSIPLSLFPHIVQDCFMMGMGLLGIWSSLYVTSDLSASFDRFICRINDLPMALSRSSSAICHIPPCTLAGLTRYYECSKTDYTAFGKPITFDLMTNFIWRFAVTLFVALWLVNT